MTPDAVAAVDHALYSYLNRSTALSDPIDVCDLQFRATNVLFSAFDDCTGASESSETGKVRAQHRSLQRSLQRLMTTGLPGDDRWELLNHPDVVKLAEFRPLVLDHARLSRFRFSDDIPDDIRSPVSRRHATFVRRLERTAEHPNARNRDETLNALADLLWMVRSNIVHDEKTASGPVPARNERDRAIASAVVPVLDALFDLVLGRPSGSLLVYGTLAPGEVNEAVLATVVGTWEDAVVHGELWTDAIGLPRLRWEPRAGRPLQVKLFRSSDLADHWSRLDRFEGATYRRVIVRFTAAESFGTANCYESVP